MKIRLHNTRTRKKDIFSPEDPKRVTMYVCGPTVYDLVHIGNGRPAVVFDVLYRLLHLFFEKVIYVRNITDIDDKINNAAILSKRPIEEITSLYIQAYREDLKELDVLDPSIEPLATDHVPDIIQMIKTLIEQGHAYEAEKHVLFDVLSDPKYGELSGKSLQDLMDGARIEPAPYKKDPKDFILWKPSEGSLPGWNSPWGRGRPGWHIECSAMITKHLGNRIDIHGGGSDLAFPHHENESAQSRCAHKEHEVVRYWLHNGMLTMGKDKMSKSLGNIVTIRSLLTEYSGEVLRYALLSGHYRSALAWSQELLEQSKSSLDRLYQALLNTNYQDQTSKNFQELELAQCSEPVINALADDLNTPKALAAMHEIASKINKSKPGTNRENLAQELLAAGGVLGLFNKSAASYFQGTENIDVEEIERLISERELARKAKDFEAADNFRNQLTALGVEIEDTREGTRWKKVAG